MDNQTFKKQAQALLAQATADDDREWSNKYLGKNGLFNQLSVKIREVNDKKSAGIVLNELKTKLEQLLTTKQTQTEHQQVAVDFTLPPAVAPRGHLHPTTLAIEEITAIFTRLGFIRVRHPEVDVDENVFEKLNMPPEHPARDEWETFFVNVPGQKKTATAPKWVLTPHTSNGQIHEMMRLKEPPIRMINIARCYRRQSDATHTQMFHQFEGLVIDRGINITHLRGVLDYFARHFYGEETRSRIRPFHFQFTEPSFEVDFSCHLCGGTGQLKNGEKCRFCKSGWHEVGGAGMIHPNVLRACAIDPEVYTGFAFGWGVERTLALRPGSQIDDIRNLYNGDLNLLEQF